MKYNLISHKSLILLILAAIFAYTTFVYKNPETIQRIESFGQLSSAIEGVPALSIDAINQPIQVINFFGSWCPPCKAEHHYLIDLKEKTGVNIHGIAIKDHSLAVMRFLKDLGNPYATVSLEGKTTRQDFKLGAVPETFIILGSKDVIYHHRGMITKAEYEDIILPLINEFMD